MSPILSAFGGGASRGFRGRGKADIQFVGLASRVEINGAATFSQALTGLTGGIDSQARSGDLVVVCVGRQQATNSSWIPSIATSGYSGVTHYRASSGSGSNLYSTNAGLFTKLMGSTPDTEVVMNGSGLALGTAPQYAVHTAVVAVFRGARGVSVLSTNGAGQAPSPASVTPQEANSWVVVLNQLNSGGTGAPTNMTYTNTPVSAYNSLSPSPYVYAGAQFGYYSTGTYPSTYTPGVWGYSVDSTRTWISYTVVLLPSGS